MSAEMLIANTLRIAREDLDGAVQLAATGNRNAIYLCEQAAEKIIRAVLTAEGKHAGTKHHLDEMVDLLPDNNPLKAILRDIEELAAYATSYRYPTPSGRIPDSPAGSEFAEIVRKVSHALSESASSLGVDLKKRGAPAGNPGPVRST